MCQCLCSLLQISAGLIVRKSSLEESAFANMCLYERVCACVCVRVRARLQGEDGGREKLMQLSDLRILMMPVPPSPNPTHLGQVSPRQVLHAGGPVCTRLAVQALSTAPSSTWMWLIMPLQAMQQTYWTSIGGFLLRSASCTGLLLALCCLFLPPSPNCKGLSAAHRQLCSILCIFCIEISFTHYKNPF